MANKGWFNLEAAGGAIPETAFFEGDSAFHFLGLSRTQRLYGFIGCLVRHRDDRIARRNWVPHRSAFAIQPIMWDTDRLVTQFFKQLKLASLKFWMCVYIWLMT
ncbi:hypothetical protein C0989_004511 [Termitomyces sp. Mn162]|nr:hypothetical protein C0989_004511 [Termitomyces sp. Mn162]